MAVAKAEYVKFTKEMKRDYTILVPTMLPIHFKLISNVLISYGYKVDFLDDVDGDIKESGLRLVHNDTCYPALLVIGQLINAIESGRYDKHKIALLITQTGGGCRASNYIYLLRKALAKAGYGYIPVISLNFGGLEKHPGFSLTVPMLYRMLYCAFYGDLMMLMANQCRPYEKNPGETDALVKQWTERLLEENRDPRNMRYKHVKKNYRLMAEDFAAILGETKRDKVKVGIVGEIYVKYSKMANNGLEDFLAEQDCEVCLPGLMGFASFKVDNRIEDYKMFGGNRLKYEFCKMLLDYVTKLETLMVEAAKRFDFVPPHQYAHTKELVKGVIGYGSKMGEGWLLTAEMLELAENGYENIVCTQPFGCLPNHINGKGAIRKIKEIMPNANIVTIDYDPGAPKVNQENRIKLMLAVGKEELQKKLEARESDAQGRADAQENIE